ncbi:carbonic anhydrase [Brachybacterium sp. EF45031]|uniref:carbonic anhydrase n=1 Tax=Brachybacterium sillae TaxID=2810536 RepID=UPI00217E33BC|nr:carbonic anhydrase [Brachybacterium sillae]MCS6711268.1 carbonic anhydrase [Brachybacterium sillae]
MLWPVPDEHHAVALRRLWDGNARFVAGHPERPHQDPAFRTRLDRGQAPFAAVLGCSDSRVPVEMLFDQGFGDLFVIRNAGHVPGSSTLASVEFAVAELGVDVVMVLGHESCGAVAATVSAMREGTELPAGIPVLVDLVRPHLSEDGSGDPVVRHVCGTIEDLLERSPLVRTALERGEIAVAGAVYALDDGTVRPVWSQDRGALE